MLKESVSGQGLNEQSCGESKYNVEVVQAVFIPIEHHPDPDVLEAKQESLRTGLILVFIMELMIKSREKYQQSGLFQKDDLR